MLKSICVYCGSRRSVRDSHQHAAADMGRLLADHGIRLIYGGGHVGMMGILADAALAAGGEVIGVIPVGLQEREVAHDRLTQLHVVDDMHQRKAMMAELAEGFIAMPGGLGTLEELFEMLTWRQINIHVKPVGLLNVDGYYDHLLQFLEQSAASGYIRNEDISELLQVDTSPRALLAKLGAAN